MLSTACCRNPGQLLSTLRGKGILWIINMDGLRLGIPCNCELIPLKGMTRKLWWSIKSTKVPGGYKTLLLGERECITQVQPVLWPHQAQLASAGKQRRQPTARSPFADAALFLSACGREKMSQALGKWRRGECMFTAIAHNWHFCFLECLLTARSLTVLPGDCGLMHPASLMLWLEAA